MDKQMPALARGDTADQFDDLNSSLWRIAVGFYLFGDLITTSLGLPIKHIAEIGPITSIVYREFGLAALILLKLAVLLAAGVSFRAIPSPYRLGIPLGLSVVGVPVTLWNLLVLVIAIW
jgi:hypothetical protein